MPVIDLMNEEFPVGASHQLAPITSLPFVHTARRYYRSDGQARSSDRQLTHAFARASAAAKTIELGGLEEVKVVTRSP